MGQHEYDLLKQFELATGWCNFQRCCKDISGTAGTFKIAKTFLFKLKYQRDKCLIDALKLLCSVWDRQGECPFIYYTHES